MNGASSRRVFGSNERLAAIIDFQQRIAVAGFDAAAIMRVVAERLSPLVGASAVGLGLIEGDEIVYRGPRSDPASGTRISLASSLSGQCVATRTAVRCDDTQSDATVAQAETRAAGVRSLLIVPLSDEGGVIGALAAMSRTPNAFTDDDLRTLELLAGILASALRHAVAYEEKVRMIGERTEMLEHLRAILDTEPDCVKVVDRDGRLLDMNPAGLAMLEVESADALKGEPLEQFVVPEYRAAFGAIHAAAFEGQSGSLEFMLRGRSGRLLRAQTRVVPLRDAAGAITAALAITRDMTEQYAAAEALRASEAQLRQSQKMEAVGQLAGGVAHDFNNMLTVITAHTEMLDADTGIVDARREHIVEIAAAAARAASLTRQLLAFSRKQILRPEPLELDAVIHGLEPMLRRLIVEDVRILIAPPAPASSVFADRGQIEQVVLNLAVNARDAMPSGGMLALGTSLVHVTEREAQSIPGIRHGHYVTLTVRDTGIGMPPEIRDRVFEPFFTTKDPGAGTGLGLSTAYGIIQQSGGTITVDSVVGKGTRFVVYLPYARSSATAHEHAGESQGPASTPEPARAETILLVEDAAPVRAVARRLLENAGYRVLEAENGRAGLAMANAHEGTIDLVLTDVVMPEMDGRLMVEALRRKRPGVAVTFMSGYMADEILRHGVVARDQSFVQKPFTTDTLLSEVETALRASLARRSAN